MTRKQRSAKPTSALRHRWPIIKWAIVYVALIPAYALIYSFLPSHFYHSTLRDEFAMQAKETSLCADLRRTMIDGFRKRHGEATIVRKGLRLDPNDFTVTSLMPELDGFSFSLKTSTTLDDYPTLERMFHYRRVFLKRPAAVSEAGEMASELWEWSNPWKVVIDGTSSMEYAEFGFDDVFGSDDGQLTLLLPTWLTDEITAYFAAARGRDVSLSGRFLRMVYLSAVTVTTLGYGDIVPLTNCARLLISSEAVLGLVIIGFFINAAINKHNGDVIPERLHDALASGNCIRIRTVLEGRVSELAIRSVSFFVVDRHVYLCACDQDGHRRMFRMDKVEFILDATSNTPLAGSHSSGRSDDNNCDVRPEEDSPTVT